MPIEIKELHIRVAVNASNNGQPASRNDRNESREEEKNALVAECVEQVLEVLRKKAER